MSAAPAYHVIAIDGPAASGKSSVARRLAERLGFVYVNSGAMYRAVTWFVLEQRIEASAPEQVTASVNGARIECVLIDHQLRLLINGFDPTPSLRDDDVNNSVSRVSAVPRVREIIGEQMRAYAHTHDLVTEGRDIGSVVFPDTPFKFYIDASPEVRSRRRAAQGEQDAIGARDMADSSRANAPLIIAKDAEVIDTSEMTIDAVVDAIVIRLRARGFTGAATPSLSSASP